MSQVSDKELQAVGRLIRHFARINKRSQFFVPINDEQGLRWEHLLGSHEAFHNCVRRVRQLEAKAFTELYVNCLAELAEAFRNIQEKGLSTPTVLIPEEAAIRSLTKDNLETALGGQ